MLCLRFRMDGGSFGLDAARIVELAPWVELWPLKSAPAFVSGCFNYRGRMAPAIDLSMLFVGKPSAKAFSTRMAIVKHPAGFMGLLLEGAVETVNIAEAEFQDACVRTANAPFLGRMAVKEGELLQVVDVDSLLNDSARRLIFQEEGIAK